MNAAPTQEGSEIGLGMDPRLALVARQIGGHRQPQGGIAELEVRWDELSTVHALPHAHSARSHVHVSGMSGHSLMARCQTSSCSAMYSVVSYQCLPWPSTYIDAHGSSPAA